MDVQKAGKLVDLRVDKSDEKMVDSKVAQMAGLLEQLRVGRMAVKMVEWLGSMLVACWVDRRADLLVLQKVEKKVGR